MKQFPLVSVVIPVYNTEKFLDECLSSICTQTYKNIEVIMLNVIIKILALDLFSLIMVKLYFFIGNGVAI